MQNVMRKCATFEMPGCQSEHIGFLKGEMMKVDVYKRPMEQGVYSYLAVPEGKPIPHEATNTDWETAEHNVDLDPNQEPLYGLVPDDALEQISAKGYAISSVNNMAGTRPRM